VLWSGILKGRKHFEGLGTNGRIILVWILKKQNMKRRIFQVVQDRNQVPVNKPIKNMD
jgi:hypothetical protein